MSLFSDSFVASDDDDLEENGLNLLNWDSEDSRPAAPSPPSTPSQNMSLSQVSNFGSKYFNFNRAY